MGYGILIKVQSGATHVGGELTKKQGKKQKGLAHWVPAQESGQQDTSQETEKHCAKIKWSFQVLSNDFSWEMSYLIKLKDGLLDSQGP